VSTRAVGGGSISKGKKKPPQWEKVLGERTRNLGFKQRKRHHPGEATNFSATKKTLQSKLL